MDRNTYIENNDDVEALRTYLDKLDGYCVGTEKLTPLDAYDRVTAKAVYALKCDPMYNAAAMDGIMVVAELTESASESKPLKLTEHKDFEYVNTGNAVTKQYNAVIMIEDVIKQSSESADISIISPAYPWQHVRVIGESIVAGEMVLPSNHNISAADIGAIIASGNKTVEVICKPKVGIIPTGNEMIDNPDELEVGKLMESNSKVFSALATKYGGCPKRYAVVVDDREMLKKAIKLAVLENDIVIVNAGSSAGTKDYTVGVIAELGEVVKHGIAIKPGKPTILGVIDGKPVVGIPGYPVSAYLVFDMFLRPIITLFAGRNASNEVYVKATLTKRITSSFKNAELIRMAVGAVGDKLVATPLDRGAAAIMSLVKADGLLKVDRLVEGVEAGETVNIRLLKPLEDIRQALVIIGSHDLIIDVIADKMPVSSAHVGSMSGIFALARGECMIAPIHLLDEESGEYNISYVKQYFKGQKMALIKGVGRVQGFVVPKNNPKNIKDFVDLKTYKLSFASRQRGAGTRLLFDFKLKENNLQPSDIIGYEKEFSTHLAVAVAVKNNIADTGLAVLSAAKAMELDFVPVGLEEYDFLLPYEYLNDKRVQKFIEVLNSKYFKDKLVELGGYTMESLGKIVVIE
ncbi:MAG: molybdopterin biosynthesis protein [Clostridia bacterium]